MPKMKTNRLARKKIRVGGKGRLKKAQANTSHNTGKRSNKRMRPLRKRTGIHETNEKLVRAQLPYA
jgi:large subunit ribosomal protein L35